MLYERARTHPDEVALDDLVRTRTWRELADRTARVAGFLRDEAGLAPGEPVALLLGNRVEGIELLVGAIAAGLWVTPINWHLREDEIDYVVADSGARVLFADDAFAAAAERAASATGGGCRVVRAGAELDALLAQAPDAPPDPDAPAGGNMIYTSGTTGRPKGVRRARSDTLGAAVAGWRAYGRRVGLDGSGPHLVTGPLYHAAPLMFAVYDQVNGAPVVVQPRFEERSTLGLVTTREIAHTHLVPTMFVRLLRLPDEERAAFRAPRLDLVLHGAAPVSVDVKRRMIDWWGPVLVEYWGGTEGGVNTLIDSRDWLAHPGSVGRPLPDFEVWATDESGARLPDGEIGELRCRSRRNARVFEYHGDPDKTRRAHPEPGVFTLGDIGRVDADGFVYLLDRRSHTIISGGVNVYPAEVEQVLLEHPAVSDVAVFGVPDEEWGESVKAAVELAPDRTASPELEAELVAFARERLAGYKAPRSVDFERALPRHPSGKLRVRELRDPYWQGRERRI